MKKISYVLCFLFIALISVNAVSQEKAESMDDFKKELSAFIKKTMKKTKTVGLSFALVDNQEIVWSDGFGFSDKEKKVKATSKTIYRVGSISKLFTATSVMQLSDNGKLNIDNPIQTYIPEFNIKSRFANPGVITPRNVLTHHSGLPSDILYQFFDENPDPISSIVGFLNKEYTCTQPNTIFSYSNAGFTLLGAMVERVSGESFNDYTQKHLFQPLEMKNSSFVLTPEMSSLYSKGYAEGKEFKEPLIRDMPAGLLHSNVLDMANFIKMTFNNGNFNGNQIIKAETLKEMQTKQNLNCKLDFNFNIGLCWWLNSSKWDYAGGFAGHGGDTYVYHGQLSTLTDKKIGVVVLENTDRGASSPRTVAKEILQKYLEFKEGLKPEKENNKYLKTHKLPEQKLDAIAGDYVLGTDLFTFKVQRGKLVAKQGPVKLVFAENNIGSFSVKAKILGIISIKVKNQLFIFRKIDGVEYVLLNNGAKDTLTIGQRINKSTISDVWRKRFGVYEIENDSSKFKLVSNFTVKEKDGLICVEAKVFNKDNMSFVLRPISENEAIVEGIGRSTGGTAFFDGDEFYYTGMKMKKKVDDKKSK